jgi:lysyl-tRNA synthetase class 2
MTDGWRPGADLALLQARAALLQRIRGFFRQREFIEVETPLLCSFGVTDPSQNLLRAGERYLQTSPEYAMKRLLAAGSGPIYQICKAFRAGEAGPRHNPEFTLLEWYRPGFDLSQMMEETGLLVSELSGLGKWQSCSYAQLFEQYLQIDPHRAATGALRDLALAHVEISSELDTRDAWLDLLLSHVIEPQIVGRGLLFVYDYPESQAALARTREQDDIRVAERFELYMDGVELANGYSELTDAGEQSWRFERERLLLQAQGRADRQTDTYLLAALESGLPACSGVALGLDRLLMAITGSENMSAVLSFGWDRS